MNKKNGYVGIDCARVVAALLICAIHTSPLSSLSEQSNFIMTRVIGRLAVPFFFITSGFFLISRYARNDKKLWNFVKKTATIYLAAIVFYIPIMIYNHYFAMDNLMFNIIKDIVWDGTMYHLWYLPASMSGAVIAWYLVRRIGYKKAIAITAVLYLIGLFGDSYYGIAESVLGLQKIYALIFEVSDYTRNGLFFAPIFFVFGGMIADLQHCHNNVYDSSMTKSTYWQGSSLRKCIVGFVFSFLALFAEAMTLFHYDLQRHDSMYLFLPVCTFFLFGIIVHWRGNCTTWLRTATMLCYILHPMMIVMIRFVARLTRTQAILVDNSVVHYVSVCIVSCGVAGITAFVWNRFYGNKKVCRFDTNRAWIELNINHLEHNVQTLCREMAPNSELMAVVKAQGYGHGLFEIAVPLNKMGIKAFAVATIEEGICLRTYGVCGEILILGYTHVNRARELKKYNLTQTLIDFEYAKELDKQNILVKVHIKVDTGMHRLGMSSNEVQKAKKIFGMRHLNVCGIYTHLACADSLLPEAMADTEKQIDKFYHFIDTLEESGISIPKIHLQSSYGFLNYPQLQGDYVRMGIALYGILSTQDSDTILKLDLLPVLSLKARVVLVRTVRKGESVGYDRAFIAQRNSRIAILPIGYADGYPRSLSCGRGRVLINGQSAPIVGRVCMDQLAVDVTDLDSVSVGDVAILIDANNSKVCSAPKVAQCTGSISNELLSRMGTRLPIIEC